MINQTPVNFGLIAHELPRSPPPVVACSCLFAHEFWSAEFRTAESLIKA
jgi:hypothetical protein